MKLFGLDISEMNRTVNMDSFRKRGVEFIIIRCGYGSDYRDQDDNKWEQNVKKCIDANMPWGAYLYSYATDISMAKSEAKHALRLLNGRKPPYGIWYDMEDSSTTWANLTPIAQTFCDTMKQNGLYTGIYASTAFFNSYLNNPALDKYDKWVAQYNSVCEYKKSYGIWQFTDKIIIDNTEFDGDYCYKDYPALTGSDEMTFDEFYKMFKIAIASYNSKLAKKATPEWAKKAMQWAYDNKLVSGDKSGATINELRPMSEIQRDEMIQIISRYAEFTGDK